MPARILVVDDEVGLCSVLQDLLEFEGYEVVTCSDSISARGHLASSRFDLAMLDVFISHKPEGIDLAKHILSGDTGTSVILMTGYADAADIGSAYLSGAYTCISKPFNLDAVVRTVGLVLGDAGCIDAESIGGSG